ncbi:MAG: proline--tRNA ligase [Myxococcales bacterium]|nr:proline--tRNA ligase [Myxococcales bacterium]
MRFSQAFIPTLKEVPADAQVASHVFMLRGGYIRKVASGIYSFMPLGMRVLSRIETIVREELDRAGAQEVLMPASVPAELWQESGRWQKYGPELLRFKDRGGADFCFGPTHEEVAVDMVRRETKSYRQLPINLYQIQTKFRDEMRPRAGLMRGREFVMKDAYSFDVDQDAALISYKSMYEAYKRIFARCGLDFRPVEADTGAIGGNLSHEFQVLAETGEDKLVACDSCGYAANVEEAAVRAVTEPAIGGGGDLTKVPTPGAKTIADVCEVLKVDAAQTIKSLVYTADGEPLVVLIRGDRTLNEIALKKLTGATELFLAREGQAEKATGAPVGSIGPAGLSLPIYADLELEGATGVVAGAGEEGMHYTGLDLARDCTITKYVALRIAEEGEGCPRCDGEYKAYQGIEVGHVFSLGTVYSEPMGCTFLDEGGKSQPMVMGCYGIGITRVAAAAIEQNHDEGGIIWPMSIAPYEVTVLPLQMKDDDLIAAAQKLYEELRELGVDVLLDDRNERPGAKFKDADLIGIPLRITIGKRSLGEGNLEMKWRREAEATQLPAEGAAEAITSAIAAEKERIAAI